MALTPYSGNTDVIAALGTTPQERGLTTEQFKAKFDEAFKKFITEYFNTTHIGEINSHKAETTSELISYNRALPGVDETVTIMLSENRTPKRIDVRVAAYDVETRKTMSIGSWEQNRQDCIACVGNTGGFVWQSNYVSSLIDTWGGATSMITIQNVRQGAFDIAITAISGGSAGGYNFQFVVHYHD